MVEIQLFRGIGLWMPYPSVSLDHEAQTAADMRTNNLFILMKGTQVQPSIHYYSVLARAQHTVSVSLLDRCIWHPQRPEGWPGEVCGSHQLRNHHFQVITLSKIDIGPQTEFWKIIFQAAKFQIQSVGYLVGDNSLIIKSQGMCCT